MLLELPTNRTGVWFSGHVAGKVGFFLGVPLAGPFFVGRIGGGVGGESLWSGEGFLLAGASLSGVLVPVVLSSGGSDEGIPPSVGKEGVVVLPWRACIKWFQARWDRDHFLLNFRAIDCCVSR